MSIATASDVEIAPAPARPLAKPLLLAAGCAALADWLFYGWQIGISLALFLAVLGAAALAGDRARAPRQVQIMMAAIFVAGLLALIEDVNALSVAVATLATALFAIVVTAREASSWPHRLLEAVTIPLRGPFQLVGDLFKTLQSMKGHVPEWLSVNSLVAWIIPLAACFVFFSLFASANPLIEYRLQQIDLRAVFDILNPHPDRILDSAGLRDLAVIAAARAADPALAIRTPHRRRSSDLDHLFGVQAVTRSLVLFNVLFALQSALDLTYLWGGASLPDGMTHAHYAHRGAYPLIATALLAAGFVLIAMRPGGPAEQSRLIRPLVLAMDRAKRPAGGLLDLPARSLCRGLLADLSAACGLHLDGAGRAGLVLMLIQIN